MMVEEETGTAVTRMEAMGTVVEVGDTAVAAMGVMDTVEVEDIVVEAVAAGIVVVVGAMDTVEAEDIVVAVTEAMDTAVEAGTVVAETADHIVGAAAGDSIVVVVAETVGPTVAVVDPIVVEEVAVSPKVVGPAGPAVEADTIRVVVVVGAVDSMVWKAAMEAVAAASEVVAVGSTVVVAGGVAVEEAVEVVAVEVQAPMEPEVEGGDAAGGVRSFFLPQSWSRPHLCQPRLLLKPSSKQYRPLF